jgi:hypothetical protein
LAIAVNQGDKIVTVLQRIVVPVFLVTAVSLIPGVEKNDHRKRN